MGKKGRHTVSVREREGARWNGGQLVREGGEGGPRRTLRRSARSGFTMPLSTQTAPASSRSKGTFGGTFFGAAGAMFSSSSSSSSSLSTAAPLPRAEEVARGARAAAAGLACAWLFAVLLSPGPIKEASRTAFGNFLRFF